MMIEKIDSIQDFGVFIDYEWYSQKENFNKYNFFYGWNYSGKTTLSRLFSFIEAKEISADYKNAKFKIGNITEKNIANHNLLVRVFNEDFIEKNFKWNDTNHKINPVLILGKESIELNQKLLELEEKKKPLEDKKKELENQSKKQQKELDTALSSKASSIREILGITNQKEFDKNKLEDKMKEFLQSKKDIQLSEKDIVQKKNIYQNSRNYEDIPEIKIDVSLKNSLENVNQILTKQITVQQIIPKLKENPTLNQWVRQGIDLHKKETTCQFCGNELPSDLFEKLNQHFSEEFNSLIIDITRLEKNIQEQKTKLESVQCPDKARFYEEFQNGYEREFENTSMKINDISKQLEILLTKLKLKREKPFEVLEKVNTKNLEQELFTQIENINNFIQKNNEKIQNLDKEKSGIKRELLEYYSYNAYKEIGYENKKREIETDNQEYDRINLEINQLEQEIQNIKTQIKKANIGADKINNYLKEFFYDNRLSLVSLEDSTYQIHRNGSVAKNLSTGEKNIISLIYFITKLEEDNFDIKNATIFIDDPVSSLDSNHTYKVYGFLKEKVLYCKQLFITTHNFEFFNLLKDLVEKKERNFYLIKSIYKDSKKHSVIMNLPNVLEKFKSEYNYLFHVLKQFYELSDKNNFELIYLLPNVARRFLEAYLFQRYPNGKKFKEKCKIFFQDYDKHDKIPVLKFLDEHSHEENPEHSQKFPDITELENIVKAILEQIKNKDKEHYDALVYSLN